MPSPDTPGSMPLNVAVGMHVEVELVTASGERERLALHIVPDSKADFAAGYLGAGTPLAQTIIGEQAGCTLPYCVADVREVRILSVRAGHSDERPDVSARRQAVIQDAVERSNLEDAVRLALSVNVKWGEYDPEGLTRENDRRQPEDT